MNQALARHSSVLAGPLLGRRLGPHHFAYLRAVAEGLEPLACAQRFLGLENSHEHRRAHTLLVDQVRALARRAGERAWRLVGLTIRSTMGAAPGCIERPALQAFIEANDLDGWSEEEQLELYEAAHPSDRLSARRDRLRQRQIELLRRLEGMAAQAPRPSDLVSDWFDEVSARKLIQAGHTTLQALAEVIAAGGRWYRTLPGVGVGKAQRIAAHLLTLIPDTTPPARAHFSLGRLQNPVETSTATQPPPQALAVTQAMPSMAAPAQGLLDARNDLQAVQAWIRSRCSSGATVKCYEREARRLMLWLQVERGGRGLSEMTVEDCLSYQAFLQHIPPGWISRHRLAPGEPGWAPFKGQLTAASQRQAVTILSGLFAWLTASRYLVGDPWLLVNKDTVSADQLTHALDTKSISDGALLQIQQFLDAQTPCPSVHRIRFVVTFMAAVGLRSSELVKSRLSDFSRQPEGWTLRVVGKGAKTRTVFVPRPAFQALQTYLAYRGLEGIESAPSEAPLLASAVDPMAPVSYQALYMTVKRWLGKAIAASELSSREQSELSGATTHWLRHTFGTKAVALNVPYDVIQQQLGHSSVNTTMSIYARAPLKRRADELTRAFT